MLWFVCRKIGLFPAMLHRKNVFRLFAASHLDFYLILLKTSVSVYFRGSYAVFSIMFSRTAFSFFSRTYTGRLRYENKRKRCFD